MRAFLRVDVPGREGRARSLTAAVPELPGGFAVLPAPAVRRRRGRAAIIRRAVDRSVALKAAALQAGSLAILAVVLAVALPRSFFEDFGWAAGPAVWAGCATLTALVLRLPLVPVFAGAALAGLPSLAGVLAGVHWVGAPLGVAILALWCGRLAARRRDPRTPPVDSPLVGPLAQLAEQGTSGKERWSGNR